MCLGNLAAGTPTSWPERIELPEVWTCINTAGYVENWSRVCDILPLVREMQSYHLPMDKDA
jgi:hypothetical protein